MLHIHLKCPAGGVVVLLSVLLHACAVRGVSLSRHHMRFRGGEGEDRRPAAYPPSYPPSSDMMKALEYIENLKQRNGGTREEPADYDEVDRFRVLLQLASLQDEGQPPPPVQRQGVPAEHLVKALLKTLQDQAGRDAKPAPVAPGSRAHRHRAEDAGSPAAAAPGEYGNFPRPHKKYPLMFEDEENRDAYKRATEDLDEQYAPQTLANLRSIFDELGRMATTNGQKRDAFGGDEEDEDLFSLRNLAYDDVAGGEDWVPVEERLETEEMVDRSHEEFDRALGETSDEEEEEAERSDMQRRASQDQEDADDDTKLVDYYLLKVLEMSDQTQKRDKTGEQKKRLIRPSLVDPRTVKELLELSLKLHVPPQDLIDMLVTEELRKLHRRPDTSTSTSTLYRTGQTPKVRYFSRRLPVKSKSVPEDMDREDFLDIIGVETISNEYPVRQRPLKPASQPGRVVAAPPVKAAPAPAKIPTPTGRRENLFLSELNKMPLKRQTGDVDDDDDGDVEDEVTTYLAAKILTEYPTINKRDTQARLNGQFPYELYEQAMKDYLEQADSDKSPLAKRGSEAEEGAEPTETQLKDEVDAETAAPQAAHEDAEHHGKPIAGM